MEGQSISDMWQSLINIAQMTLPLIAGMLLTFFKKMNNIETEVKLIKNDLSHIKEAKDDCKEDREKLEKRMSEFVKLSRK